QYFSLGLGYKWDKDTDIDLGIATLRSRDNIPANSSTFGNSEGIDNLVYNPFAGLDIKTEATINMIGLAFRTAF
ncbi:MAG TPA: long-chain fatty acid ABC transporter, partial [Marinobacter sp.]